METLTTAWRRPKYSGPERRKTRRWRPRPLRILLLCLGIAGIVYAAAILWLITQETRLVFQAGATLAAGRPPAPFEQVDLPRADGARQFAWAMPAAAPADAPWVLFLHGNAATVASQVNIAHYTQLRALGLNVFAPEYGGFGGLPGVPTEASLATDARAAYDYLRGTRGIPAHRIVIYGWSLGGAVAVGLSSRVEEAAVILEGAPASLLAIGQLRYPFFPIRWIMRNPFDAVAQVDRSGAPMLFLHSADDAVIPISEGRRLFEAAREPKTFVEVEGGHVHASEVDARRFYGSIVPFLEQHGVIGRADASNRPRQHGAGGH